MGEKTSKSGPLPIVMIDKLTTEIVARYDSCHDASRETGVYHATIFSCAKRHTLPTGRYYYRFESDFDPFEDFSKCHNRPVVVTDTETGRRWACPDCSYVSEKLEVTKKKVSDSILKGTLIKKRLKVDYLR